MPRKTAVAKRAPAKTPVVPDPDHENPTEEPEDWFADASSADDYVNMLLYGREGSGKTTALSRLSTMGRVLVINAEGGVKVQPLRKMGVDTDNLKIYPRPGSGVLISHRVLDKLYRRVKADLLADPKSWVAVGFDSITEVYQALLDDVQRTRVAKLRDKGAEPDEFFVDIADYGTMSKMVRDLLRKFRDLPCHVVFTALERRDVDADTKKPQYGPDITPALQKDLLGYPDLVLMFKSADEDGPHRALTRANSRYRAKDRFGVLPKVLPEPMGDRIIQYVTGELDIETDPFMEGLSESVSKSLDRKTLSDEDDDEEDDD